MGLLSIEHVGKRFRHGRGERVALKDVSLVLEPGEMVAVLGGRRSGRTTLLRVAAGLDLPDEGVVRFDSRDLRDTRDRVLGREIGYVHTHFPSTVGKLVIDHVMAGLLAADKCSSVARHHAREIMVRAGVEGLDDLDAKELDGAEGMRVGIARALVASPRLLVVDDPTSGVDLLDRDPILGLLRSIANEGVAVLMTTGDATALSGVDRALAISDGELRGDVVPEDATVIPIHRSTQSGAA
jgi:ABC-type multidrug transport system ATPase subunit